jgi:HEAT repeat protein
MLEKLEACDWSTLYHAYGVADDVPELLSDLTSPDDQRRSDARWHLYGTIFHQGARYEASPYAVPTLLALAARPTVPERDQIVRLLTSLAIGYEEWWLPAGHPPVADLVARRPSWLNREDLRHHLATYGAVSDGVPVLRGLLNDPDPAVRASAAHALAWFPDHAAETLPPLLSACDDPAPIVAATALVATSLLSTSDDALVVERLRSAFDRSEPAISTGGAIGLAWLAGADAPPQIAGVLVGWATEDDDVRAEKVPFMFLGGDLRAAATSALARLGGTATRVWVGPLCTRLPTVSRFRAAVLLETLLGAAFPDSRPGPTPNTPFGELTPLQQASLRALLASPHAFDDVCVPAGMRRLGQTYAGLRAYYEQGARAATT